MIEFKTIRFKNFLSFGNQFTEIFLNKSKTTLISGGNGDGKCVFKNTIVKIKNKETGEIREITIGDLYEQEKQNN